MIRERKIEKEYGEMMANFMKEENNNKILSKILNKKEYDYFINYIKENINNINNNKNVNEFMINENENNENSILRNKNEINKIQYNKPFKNEEEKKYNINEKSLEIKMNSYIEMEKEYELYSTRYNIKSNVTKSSKGMVEG